MAPANGSSKSRKGSKQGNSGAQGSSGAAVQPKHATGAATPKAAVVPALPLSYGKKKVAGDAAAVPEDANVAEQDKKTNARKGGADKHKKPANEKNSAATNAAKQPAEPKKNEKDKKDIVQSEIVTATAKKDEQTGTSALIVGGSLPVPGQIPKSGTEKKPEAPKANNTSTKPNPRSSISPTGYQMPPPFHPANRPPHFHAGNGPEPTHNTHRHGHQPHPSNGSIHFGAFPGSQASSSPAPPLSAGGMPAPPGMGMSDGHQHFMGHASNGFPPAMHYGPDMMPMPAFDNFGRPNVGFPPMDSYNPYGRGYGPSGPHSFHGSQSSNAEEMGLYNHFHHGPPPGSNGNGENGRGMNGNGNPYGFNHMIPRDQQTQQGDEPSHADELAQYIAQQFGNTTLSDCTLELRYLDDRSAPVRIPGHRIIFNRNPRLAELIRQQTLPPSPSGNTAQTLLLETGSKWIRSDSFYTAVQYLYGLPLLPRPGVKGNNEPAEFSDAGSHTDKLDFALAYAAAGHLLDCTPVLARGCQVAASLINWQTIERVLEFALEDFRDHGLHDAYKYGVGSKTLLDAVVTFIVQNFPPTFDLDIFVADPVQFARLPVRLAAAARPPATESEQKLAEAHESTPSVQFGKGRRSQKVTGIQFGDLTVPDAKPSESETPRASRQAQPVSHAVLSRILLNIPFTQLKMIMESSGSGNVHGWANAESRYKIVKSAVEERETLRHRALQAVLDGSVVIHEAVMSKLRSPEPRESDEWSVLGWMEEMLPYGNMDGPSLSRKWVPISIPQGEVGYPATEYP